MSSIPKYEYNLYYTLFKKEYFDRKRDYIIVPFM